MSMVSRWCVCCATTVLVSSCGTQGTQDSGVPSPALLCIEGPLGNCHVERGVCAFPEESTVTFDRAEGIDSAGILQTFQMFGECDVVFTTPCSESSGLLSMAFMYDYAGRLPDSSFYNIGDNQIFIAELESGRLVGTLFTPDPEDSLEPQCDNFYFGDPDGLQCAVDAFEAVWAAQEPAWGRGPAKLHVRKRPKDQVGFLKK